MDLTLGRTATRSSRRRHWRSHGTGILAAGIALALLAGCAGNSGMDMEDSTDRSGREDVKVVDQRKAKPIPGVRLASLPVEGNYPLYEQFEISPGDVLDIVYNLERTRQENYPITLYHTVAVKFVDAPELNETQEVLPDGSISLPYIGRVEVVGMTTTELVERLRQEYDNILQSPEIYVKIQNFNALVEQIRRDLQTSARGLSKLVTVRPDGFATFPLVGHYKVAQRTIEDVEAELKEDYQQIVDGLNATLFMHEQTGNNIYVLGEVEEPGTVQVNRPLNVLQALAEVGGYTNEGVVSNTIVFRKSEQQLVAHRFDLNNMDEYGLQASQFYLQPDDVLLVPRSKISSAAQLMREIADITFFNGWGINVGEITVTDE